jgi:hypothetical protein
VRIANTLIKGAIAKENSVVAKRNIKAGVTLSPAIDN